MKLLRFLFIVFLVVVFISGFFVLLSQKNGIGSGKEGFDNTTTTNSTSTTQDSCPDLLIQKGAVLLLYNTKQPLVDGTNPIPFFNLDEYIQYLENQRIKGMNCPVLYLQEETNTQGQDVYRMRPSPFDLQGGLPPMVNMTATKMPVVNVKDASRENTIYNKDQYAGFDPQGQYIGVYTNIDKIHDSTDAKRISDNPMDDNWAGTTYTQQMIDSGKYEDNNITRPKLFQPKNTAFYPTISNDLGIGSQPRDIL
jgi:hypothetical protein